MEEAKKGEAGQPSSSAPRFGESATLIFFFFCSLNSSPRNPDQSLPAYLLHTNLAWETQSKKGKLGITRLIHQ